MSRTRKEPAVQLRCRGSNVSRKFSARLLLQSFKEGRGFGVGEDYRPWIQITRRTSSPYSNLNLWRLPYLHRNAHFLSRGERQMAVYVTWLGAEDVREQYPLWPWPHPHPEVQLGADRYRVHPGMLAVAESAGVRLQNYPGTKLPVVLSMDLLCTVPPGVNCARLVAVSCKPRSLYVAAAVDDRELERLELDRRYCLAGEIPFHLAHPEELPTVLMAQLNWLAPVKLSAPMLEISQTASYQDYIGALADRTYLKPASIASAEASRSMKWSGDFHFEALRFAIWHQHIDVDLCRQLDLSQPLRPGGRKYRDEGVRRWLRAIE